MSRKNDHPRDYSTMSYEEWANCIREDPSIADRKPWHGPIPESAEEIVFKSFRDREDLVDVKLPKNLTAIGLSAFINCENLRSVTLPRTLKKIETWAFSGTKLKDIYYEGTIEEFDRIDFGGLPTECIGTDNYRTWCSDRKPVIHCSNGDIDFGDEPFYVKTLQFAGTKADWNARYGKGHWFNRRVETIHCADGNVQHKPKPSK